MSNTGSCRDDGCQPVHQVHIRRPVITVNVAAGLAFGLLVVITEQYLGVQWDELMLTIVGSLFLLAATAIARSKVFSPLTHAAEVEAALMQGPPKPPRA